MVKLSQFGIKGLSLLKADYDSSVVRRTLLFLVLIVPAFLANFLVYYLGARLLPADQFGLFYVANTVGNVIFSAALIFNIFFSRLLVQVGHDRGEIAVLHALRRLENVIVPIGGGIAILIIIALLLLGGYLKIPSQLVIVLIVLDAYTAYVADLGRTLLQSLNRTVSLGLYTLALMIARFVFCMIGILIFNNVSGALAGVVTSAVLVIAIFRILVARRIKRLGADTGPRIALPSITAILPVVIGYGLMTTMTNLDVLVSYFALKEADLGVYSASSVFPKAILVVMTPVSQMLFPMMFQRGAERRDFLTVVAKICITVLFASIAAAGMTWLLSDYLCGGTIGLKLCSIPPLSALLLAAIPLALLRIAALFQLARGRDALLLFLLLPIAIYAYFVLKTPLDVDSLASSFAIFSYAGLVFFAVLSGVRELGSRAAARSPSASLRDPLA